MSAHNQKSAFPSYYHDTWTLLKNYRSVSWSIEVSDYNLQAEFRTEYGCASEAVLDGLEASNSNTHLESYVHSLERSKRMLQLINSAIDLMRKKHEKGNSITGFCTMPISPRSSARMRVQFCRHSNLRASPFLCAPTMSTGMKLSRSSAPFCGAIPLRIARKSPIC